MTEPQMTLRSLGLIQAKGWTHLTTTIMKMANKEIGYEKNHKGYKQFLEDGKFSFLPQSWQGEFGEESEINVWHAFLLGTLKRTEYELLRINGMLLALYLGLILACDVLRRVAVELSTWRRQRREGASGMDEGSGEDEEAAVRIRSSFFPAMLRIFIGYGLIIALAQIPMNMVNNSNWGKAIRYSKAYRPPWIPADSPLPSTLPHTTDILWTQPAYASSYMTSYSKVLDFGHPGNAYWKDFTLSYSSGYAALSVPLQQTFCDTMLDRIQRERRFLAQDTERFWFKVVDADALARYCHRELTMAFDPLLESLLNQVDALKGDIQYGFWRDMAIHKRTIPAYLDRWEQRLLPWPREREIYRKGPASVAPVGPDTTTTRLGVSTSASFLPASQRTVIPAPINFRGGQRRYALPPPPLPKEPTRGAWFQEGDRVLAQHECNKRNSTSGSYIWMGGGGAVVLRHAVC
jgi:hypothetical protein